MKPTDLSLHVTNYLTRYLAGQRKHYVLPLRLYLTISVIALLLLRLTTNLDVDEGNKAIDIGANHGTWSVMLKPLFARVIASL